MGAIDVEQQADSRFLLGWVFGSPCATQSKSPDQVRCLRANCRPTRGQGRRLCRQFSRLDTGFGDLPVCTVPSYSAELSSVRPERSWLLAAGVFRWTGTPRVGCVGGP